MAPALPVVLRRAAPALLGYAAVRTVGLLVLVWWSTAHGKDAYTLLTAETRRLFRAALGVDQDTWTRGLGWALGSGLSAYLAYAEGNPRIAAATRRQLSEVLAEHAAPTPP